MNENDAGLDWRIYETPVNLRVQIGRTMPLLPDFVEEKINRHWHLAMREHESLYNGHVFSVDTIAENRLVGHWTEFRRVVAQIRCPTLHAALKLQPLSVCGILLCSIPGHLGFGPTPGVVMGRRAVGSLFQAALWQFSPAGAIDPGSVDPSGEVDWRRQLLTELSEELGTRPDVVQSMCPLCIVEYPRHRGLELGVILRCSSDGQAIVEAHARFGNAEYDAIRILPLEGISVALNSGDNTWSPASRVFLPRLINALNSGAG